LTVLLIALLVPVQCLVLPLVASESAAEAPEFAYLRWPMLALSEVMLLIGDVFLIALMRLLGMVRRREVFTSAADWWASALVASLWAETAGAAGWLAVLIFATSGPPGATIGAIALLLAGTVAALTVSAMRALLAQATAQADELAAVI
jgi:hypothetical protein